MTATIGCALIRVALSTHATSPVRARPGQFFVPARSQRPWAYYSNKRANRSQRTLQKRGDPPDRDAPIGSFRRFRLHLEVFLAEALRR